MPNKTLVIGIGTTGSEVCRQIKDRILADYGDTGAVPWLKILAFDTKDDPDPILGADKVQIGISSDAYQALLAGPGKGMAKAMDLSTWTDDQTLGVKASEGTSAGAKNIRMQGRVSWMYNSKEFQGRIAGALDHLLRLTADEALLTSQAIAQRQAQQMDRERKEDRRELSLGGKISVFICGTLTGGTFSGAFIDAGYLVRTSDYRNNIDRVIGLVGIPSPKYTFENRKANAYAALCELNYYHMTGTRYSAKFPHQPAPTTSLETPFTDVFLCQPDVGAEGAEAPINAAWAQLIYLSSISDVGQEIFAEMCNVGADARGATDEEGWPMTFNSVGVTEIEYPAQWVIDGCSYRLAAEAVDAWRALREEDAIKARQTLESKFKLSSQAVRAALRTPASGQDAFDKLISDVIDDACAASGHTTDALVDSEAALNAGFEIDGKSRNSRIPGRVFLDTIASNGKRVAAERHQAILGLFEDGMTDALRGPQWALEHANALEKLCIDYLQKSKPDGDGEQAKMRAGARDDLAEARENLEEAQRAPSLMLGFRGFAVKQWTDNYSEKARDYYNLRLDLECKPWEVEVMRALLQLAKLMQERLQHSKYGLIPWAERLAAELRARHDKLDRGAPLINGRLLYERQSTIAAEYNASLGGLQPAAEEASSGRMSPSARGVLYAQQNLINRWQWVAKEIVADARDSFFDEPAQAIEKNKDRPIRQEDVQRLYDFAAPRFAKLRQKRVVELLAKYNQLEILSEVSPSGKDIFFLQVNDDANPALRASNSQGGLHIQSWAFFNGAEGAAGETPEGELRAAITTRKEGGKAIAPKNVLPLDDPTRILFIQCRSTFSLPMIAGLDPDRSSGFLDVFQEHERMRMRAISDPTGGNPVSSLFSRIDVDFPVLVSSPEDKVQQRQACAKLLAGIATEIIGIDAREKATAKLEYRLRALDAGHGDSILHLPMDLGQATRQVRTHHSALTQLEADLAAKAKAIQNAGMVAGFESFLDKIGSRELEFKVGFSALSRDSAFSLLRDYGRSVPNLIANWDHLYPR